MAVSNLAYSNSQACDICNITTYLVLLRILLQLHESTPFLATTQKLIYIKALCRGGGLSNNDAGVYPTARPAAVVLSDFGPRVMTQCIYEGSREASAYSPVAAGRCEGRPR